MSLAHSAYGRDDKYGMAIKNGAAGAQVACDGLMYPNTWPVHLHAARLGDPEDQRVSSAALDAPQKLLHARMACRVAVHERCVHEP